MSIDGPDGSVVERTMIDFLVAPAAQDTSTFVVSDAFAPFTERLREAVASEEAI